MNAKCKGDGASARSHDPEQVAVGCTLDVTKGRVRLTSGTDAAGETQSASFFLGVFRVKQKPRRARGDPEARRQARLRRRQRPRAASKRGRRRGGRGLWGDGDGRFTTRGNRGAGSVRGTQAGSSATTATAATEVRVKRGVVSFRDFVADRTVKVKAGEQYSTEPRSR